MNSGFWSGVNISSCTGVEDANVLRNDFNSFTAMLGDIDISHLTEADLQEVLGSDQERLRLNPPGPMDNTPPNSNSIMLPTNNSVTSNSRMLRLSANSTGPNAPSVAKHKLGGSPKCIKPKPVAYSNVSSRTNTHNMAIQMSGSNSVAETQLTSVVRRKRGRPPKKKSLENDTENGAIKRRRPQSAKQRQTNNYALDLSKKQGISASKELNRDQVVPMDETNYQLRETLLLTEQQNGSLIVQRENDTNTATTSSTIADNSNNISSGSKFTITLTPKQGCLPLDVKSNSASVKMADCGALRFQNVEEENYGIEHNANVSKILPSSSRRDVLNVPTLLCVPPKIPKIIHTSSQLQASSALQNTLDHQNVTPKVLPDNKRITEVTQQQRNVSYEIRRQVEVKKSDNNILRDQANQQIFTSSTTNKVHRLPGVQTMYKLSFEDALIQPFQILKSDPKMINYLKNISAYDFLLRLEQKTLRQ